MVVKERRQGNGEAPLRLTLFFPKALFPKWVCCFSYTGVAVLGLAGGAVPTSVADHTYGVALS